MTSVLWGRGILIVNFMERDTTMNSQQYFEPLKQNLNAAFKEVILTEMRMRIGSSMMALTHK
jgi:hypothetical protein